ncbi:hypothetical protein SAVIM40S_00247 [Streptomyces avidinii]
MLRSGLSVHSPSPWCALPSPSGSGAPVAHLQDDSLASVRFLARLETLSVAPPQRWLPLDRALLADAREASRHLDGAGWRWGRVLTDWARAARLRSGGAAPCRSRNPGHRRRLCAREACHDWRAAPVGLLPLLVRHCGRVISPAMAKALTTASISEAAMHAHGALVAEVPFTPYPRASRPSGSPPSSYDSATAAAVLRAEPVDTGRLLRASEIFGAVLDAGPLTFRQAAQLYNLTFKRPGRMQAMCAPLWLRHAGPTALPRISPHDTAPRRLRDRRVVLGRPGTNGSARVARAAVADGTDRPAYPSTGQRQSSTGRRDDAGRAPARRRDRRPSCDPRRHRFLIAVAAPRPPTVSRPTQQRRRTRPIHPHPAQADRHPQQGFAALAQRPRRLNPVSAGGHDHG